MPPEATPNHPFYFAAEDEGSGRFQVLAGAHVCNETASVRYATQSGTASPSLDFDGKTGRANFYIVHLGNPWVVDVPLHPDGLVEAPIESFRVSLSNPQNGSLKAPSEAPFYIVDVDGTDRATLGSEPHLVDEFETVVEIAVFRAGPAAGTLSVPYLVDPWGEVPATPGDDYTVAFDERISFGPGQRVGFIQIGIIDDGVPEADEMFSVTLPEGTPDSVDQTLVTIHGEIDESAPRSRFHHPRDGWRYGSEDYRIREIHVFTNDGDSGVVQMSIALRRNSTGGRCAWWDGTRFERGTCSEQQWLRMRAYERGWFYYYRIDPLRLSIGTGTGIKSYTAYARGLDAAGNLEEDFVVGRNRNTFDVKES